MDAEEREFLARVEDVRLAWEFALKEAEFHEHRLVQLFAVFLTAALAALGSVLLEKVAPLPGLAVMVALFGGVWYARFQMGRLPARLSYARQRGHVVIKTLIRPGGQ